MIGWRVWLNGLIRRSFLLSGLYYLWDDWRAGWRFRRGDISTGSGTLHHTLPLGESIAYLESVYSDYLRYAGGLKLSGKIAEVGPGDNCGVALLLLAGGADSVDLVDRFYSHRDPLHQAAIYRELGRCHPGVAQHLEGADLQDEVSFPGVRRHYGEDASAEAFFQLGQDYDVILSRAVLEHVRDPLLALQRMSEALRPGGILLHKVDLRDHGMFSTQHSELKWLEVPDPLYPRMCKASGRPNRVLIHAYRAALAQLPLEAELLVTRLAGVGDIDPHTSYDHIHEGRRDQARDFLVSQGLKLSAGLREVAPDDLVVTGFFLAARKKS